jgi:phosphoribosyl-ATP pyrophosphohydrolase
MGVAPGAVGVDFRWKVGFEDPPARLLAGGLPRIAQKLAEEATEVVIDAVRGERSAVIRESVDLLYNLVVLWSELGITSPEIWGEMDRRQALFGMA